MGIKELKPRRIIERFITPQCCVKVEPPTHNRKWREERYGHLKKAYGQEWKHDQCQRPSTVEIDNKPYCRLHGGHIVLEKYLRGELVDAKK